MLVYFIEGMELQPKILNSKENPFENIMENYRKFQTGNPNLGLLDRILLE